MKKIIAWAILAAVLSCSRSAGPEIEFFKENVILDIRGDRLYVTGKYHFMNRSAVAKRATFRYPFPVDSLQAFPDVIIIDRPFLRDSTGINFDLSLAPRAADSFKILYQQRLSGRRCRYITTTIRHWQRPVKTAHFTVVAPAAQKIAVNYPVSDREVVDDTVFYYIRFKNFYPGADLAVTW